MASFFPHLTSTSPAPTTNEIYLKYSQAFVKQVSDGVRRPAVFPYNCFSIFLGIAYLCLPHKQNPIVYAARWPLAVLITLFELRVIQETSGVGPSLGFTIGMQSAIIIMSSWTWLIFKRPQWDAKRVERRRVRVVRDMKNAQATENVSLKGELCQEKLENAPVLIPQAGYIGMGSGTEETYEYFWQAYPESFKQRISWVLDLVLNYRGPGWNWSISTIPSLTPDTLNKLAGSVPDESHSIIFPVVSKSCSARYEKLLYELYRFIPGYIIVDVVWTIMMKDPYFKFGPTTYELPIYLQSLNSYNLQLYRLVLFGTIFITSMMTMYAAFNIFLTCVLGPRVLGQRGEPWYYNQVWGNFSKVFDRGLGGLWGSFWHQTFRVYFTAPTIYLIEKKYIKPDTHTCRIIGLLFAFCLSGFLHWAGMMTAFPESYPFHEVIFFGLQGVGVILQDTLSKILSPFIMKLPRLVRQAGNLFFTLFWFYITGWIESDNICRAGILLITPLPFSLMNALGFGEHDASWKMWSIRNPLELVWHTGNNWWESGIVIA